jgi:hypothetical protein
LEATETMPSAPASMARAAVGSSPLSTAKPLRRNGNRASIRSPSARASLMPTMLGCSDSSPLVSAARSQPVRPGTLYSTTGSPPSSATAR